MGSLLKELKIAIVDVKKGTKENSCFTAVNMRNGLILAEELKADFLYTEKQLREKKGYDIIIAGFTSNRSDIEGLKFFYNNNPAAKCFVLCSEYEQNRAMGNHYSHRPFSIIRNFEGKSDLIESDKELVLADFFLNINLLIARQQNSYSPKKYDCVYYGRWRAARAKYLSNYSPSFFLSTSNKNKVLFHNAGCKPISYIEPLKWDYRREQLNLFRYSLYVEDEYTHTHYNCLANRWYEAGFCNNVVFFDNNCVNTIRKSEIGEYYEEIKEYVVSDCEELKTKIDNCNKNFNKHLEIQKKWRKNELNLRKNMIEELKNILYAVQS